MKNRKVVSLALIFAGCQIGGCAGQVTYGTPEGLSRIFEGQAGTIEVAKADKGRGTDYMALRSLRMANDTPAEKIKLMLERLKAKVSPGEGS